VYLDFGGDDWQKNQAISGGTGDGTDYLFYMQAVDLISIDVNTKTAIIEDEVGRQYKISTDYLRAEMPDYTADTAVKQRIIDNALRYNKGITNTCYLFIYRDSQYSGEFTPDEVEGFNCILFLRAMINSEIQKKVPTYDIPFPVKKFQYVFENDRYLYNKGYDNSFRMKKVNWEKNINNIKPTDILLLDNKDDDVRLATHVGMYLGNGDYIHCTHGWGTLEIKTGKYTRVEKYGGVHISKLDNVLKSQEKYERIIGVVRVIPEDPKPANKTMYAYAAANVNLRKEASTTSEVVTKIPRGDKVVLKYTDRLGDWAYVSYNGAKGFVSMDYLSPVVVPKATSIKSVSRGRKSFTLKWTKVTKNNNGYQIQYSLNSSFKNATTIRINSKNTTQKTIYKLKAKKKYYVRIRTFRISDNKRYFSDWDKTSVRTK
jgi:uncharacterized protein YgiM (DUF1202 family)